AGRRPGPMTIAESSPVPSSDGGAVGPFCPLCPMPLEPPEPSEPPVAGVSLPKGRIEHPASSSVPAARAVSGSMRRMTPAYAPLRVLLLEPRRDPRTLRRIQLDLADADHFWCDLDALVLARDLEALLERQLARRGHPLEHVRGGGAHVGELFL